MKRKVIVYTTSSCAYCNIAKKFLDDNHIKYEVKNVGTDKLSREEMIASSGQMGVPVIDVDGDILVGFGDDNRSRLAKILGIVQ